MQEFCVILIYNKDKTKILMCHRIKNPYIGLKNLVGGHIEKDEMPMAAAYREMEEETGITKEYITLHHIMKSDYTLDKLSLNLFAGKLKEDVEVYGDENPLLWVDADENFFDTTKYAGDGNLGHFLLMADYHKEKIF